jgi:hypothetical protein
MLRRTFLLTSIVAVTPARAIRLFDGKSLAGWYTWLRESRYEDPRRVFSVENGVLRISGEDWGGIATKESYRDYRLAVEWRWGGATHGNRKDKARNSGILIHAYGDDGAASGVWLESIECQLIEGGCGDFILVAGKTKPSLTVECRTGAGGQLYWEKGGAPVARDAGRFNWYGRDPEWKDELGFRGRNDVEKPLGEWNLSEVVCDGDRITNLVNGVVVNEGRAARPSEGKIQIQSEGAEVLIRRVELLPLKRG